MSRKLMVVLAVMITGTAVVGCHKTEKTIDIKSAQVSDVNAGDLSTGDVKTGGVQAGDVKTGEVNTGDFKAGNVKTGEVKTGAVSTGDVTVKSLDVETIRVNKVVIESTHAETLAMMTNEPEVETPEVEEPKVEKKEEVKKPLSKEAVDKLCRGCPEDAAPPKLPEICDEALPYLGQWQAVNTGDGVVAKGEYDATLKIKRDGTFKLYRSNSISEYPRKLTGTWVFDYAKQAVELSFKDGKIEWLKIDKYNPEKINSSLRWSGPLTFFKVGTPAEDK